MTKKKGLSGTAIKCLACAFMLTDHTAEGILVPLFTSGNTDLLTPILIMRSLGRLAFPLFCLLIAEGVYHTRHRLRYVLSLWLFALISEIPYDLAFYGTYYDPSGQNVYFTLAAAVTAHMLAIHLHTKWHKIFPYLIAFGFTYWIRADYGTTGILLLFFFFYGRKWMKMIAGSAKILQGLINLSGTGSLLIPESILSVLPFLLLLSSYNGKRGGSLWKNKYVYYAFYPAHLLMIGLVKIGILT